MSKPILFEISVSKNRVMGKQICIKLADYFVLKLTPAEASSLSFALVAVRDGVSPEREIYMSLIASDAAFVGTVTDSGMSIAKGEGATALDWEEVGKLAAEMAEAIG